MDSLYKDILNLDTEFGQVKWTMRMMLYSKELLSQACQ